MKDEGPYNADLKAAVKYLYREEKISTDKDLVKATGFGKSTVSEYVSGKKKASANFIEQFEKAFKLSLSDFTSKPPVSNFLKGDAEMSTQEYINELRKDKQLLLQQLDKNQTIIDVNLNLVLTVLSTLHRHDLAYHETTLKSLARLEKKKDQNALISEANIRENELADEELSKGSQPSADK